MTDPQKREAYPEQMAKILRRLDLIERALKALTAGTGESGDDGTLEWFFHLPDAVSVSQSDYAPVRRSCSIYTVTASLRIPGTTSTVIEVLNGDGDTIATATLTAGLQEGEFAVGGALTSDPRGVAVACTTAGAGAEGLVVGVRAR